jgi:hypothetical protein
MTPSPKTHQYVVRFADGGAKYAKTLRAACRLYAATSNRKPKLLQRTRGGGELLKRRVDPDTGVLHVCSGKR